MLMLKQLPRKKETEIDFMNREYAIAFCEIMRWIKVTRQHSPFPKAMIRRSPYRRNGTGDGDMELKAYSWPRDRLSTTGIRRRFSTTVQFHPWIPRYPYQRMRGFPKEIRAGVYWNDAESRIHTKSERTREDTRTREDLSFLDKYLKLK